MLEKQFKVTKPPSASLLFRVVKEEISDDSAKLPCFNGRVVSWVRDDKLAVYFLFKAGVEMYTFTRNLFSPIISS